MIEQYFEILKKISLQRKSHRVFSDRKLDQSVFQNIEEIALSSPYASGKKNWDIIFIDDKTKIVEIADAVSNTADAMTEYIREDFHQSYKKYSGNFIAFSNAPALAVLSYRTPASFSMMFDKTVPDEIAKSISEWERDNYVKSISCVAMLVLMAAESLGLGACYMTGALLAEKKIKEIIKIKPGRRIGALIPLGYKKEDK